jgi:acetoin utilization deacetylase AcuC-like enzyme
MGFCLYNNVAVAAGAGRATVAIVDYDVHHGNGTQHTSSRTERALCPRISFRFTHRRR